MKYVSLQRLTILRSILAGAMIMQTGIPCIGQEARDPVESRLIVGTREIPPFAIKNDEDTWNGVSIGLWKTIAAELNIDYEFREYPDVSSLLAAVEASEIAVAVAALTVTSDREQKVDFSMPFYTSGIGVAVRKADGGSFWRALRTVFTAEIVTMGVAILAVLLIVGTLAWIFERKKNDEHFHRRPARGIWDGFWFAAVTMTTVGYGDKSPKSIPGRVLALVWMFVGLIVISLFTAAAASALTQAQLQTQIQRSEDLLSYRCGTSGDSTSGRFLDSENISFHNYPALEEAMQALVHNDIDACVYDAPTLRYFAHARFGGDIAVLPIRFQTASYAFALPPDSPFREGINQSLLKEIESSGWPDRVERLLGR